MEASIKADRKNGGHTSRLNRLTQAALQGADAPFAVDRELDRHQKRGALGKDSPRLRFKVKGKSKGQGMPMSKYDADIGADDHEVEPEFDDELRIPDAFDELDVRVGMREEAVRASQRQTGWRDAGLALYAFHVAQKSFYLNGNLKLVAEELVPAPPGLEHLVGVGDTNAGGASESESEKK